MKTPTNTSSALSALSEPWEAATVARFNGHEVMVAKARGAYPWHKHEDTDDFFLVLKGLLTIEMRPQRAPRPWRSVRRSTRSGAPTRGRRRGALPAHRTARNRRRRDDGVVRLRGHMLRIVLSLIAYVVALAAVAVIAFFAVIFLAGPHAGLLPGWLEAVVLGLGWLAVLLLPVLAARAVWRRLGRPRGTAR